MKLSKILSLVCIIVGGAIAIYAQAETKQNTYLLVAGIVLLMFGVYNISRNIPSKFDNQKEETFVKSENIKPTEDED